MCKKITRNVLLALTAAAGLCLISCNGDDAGKEMETLDSEKSVSFSDGTYDVEFVTTAYESDETLGDYEISQTAIGSFTVSGDDYVLLLTSTKLKTTNKTIYESMVAEVGDDDKEYCTFDEENLTIIVKNSDSSTGLISDNILNAMQDSDSTTYKEVYSEKVIQQSKDGSIIKIAVKLETFSRESEDDEWTSKDVTRMVYTWTKK